MSFINSINIMIGNTLFCKWKSIKAQPATSGFVKHSHLEHELIYSVLYDTDAAVFEAVTAGFIQ